MIHEKYGTDFPFLPAGTLKALLASVPDDMLVTPCATGNLAVLKPVGEPEDFEQVAWVDFLREGAVEWLHEHDGHAHVPHD